MDACKALALPAGISTIWGLGSGPSCSARCRTAFSRSCEKRPITRGKNKGDPSAHSDGVSPLIYERSVPALHVPGTLSLQLYQVETMRVERGRMDEQQYGVTPDLVGGESMQGRKLVSA